MGELVKLRDSIILGGLQHDREKIIDRDILLGTRFDNPKFFATKRDPWFRKPPWNDREVVSTETAADIAAVVEGDPMMDQIEHLPSPPPPPTEDEIVRPRFPNEEVADEALEEEELERPKRVKKKLVRKG
jgi:hypothetical protein